QRTIKLVTHVPLHGDVAAAYEAGVARIDALAAQLAAPPTGGALVLDPQAGAGAALASSFTPPEFEGAGEAAKEHIRAGDAIQIVLAQRFWRETHASPFMIYRALRAVNPSPYMYFLDWGDFQLVGASPELLVLVENGVAMTHPIAGTRPRGETPAEDYALAAELLADDNDRAEPLMLDD